jgi:hypothetical protein
MKITKKIKYTENNIPYIEYVRKSGKYKGSISRCYGKLKKCKWCKKIGFSTLHDLLIGNGKFCSNRCSSLYGHKINPGRAIGPKSRLWTGGRKVTAEGYILIYSPNHPNRVDRIYVFEHRLVMEKYLGRYLKKNEIIHHINGIKNDNRIKNLLLTDRHLHEHGTMIKILQKRIRYLENKLTKIK